MPLLFLASAQVIWVQDLRAAMARNSLVELKSWRDRLCDTGRSAMVILVIQRGHRKCDRLYTAGS